MANRQRDAMMSGLDQLRYEPTAKRIRAMLGDSAVVDSTRAAILWEPRRVVPSYAVPVADFQGDLVPAAAAADDESGYSPIHLSGRRVLDPSIPFRVHTAPGETVDVMAAGQRLPAAGFLLTDDALASYVVLDFDAFDAWYEEDEVNVAHPRDPFHRIDVLPSSRHVRLELDGEVLAESSRPTLLFETMLPTRYYLPHEDIRAELVPSQTRTYCAYKGRASYLSPVVGGQAVADLAWTYEQPMHEAEHVTGLVAFFDERVDVVLDGQALERPITPWSPRPASS